MSPTLAPPILFAFTTYPLFEWYPQIKEILLYLSMKRWNRAFNAKGSRLIIVVVQVGAVKIYVAAVKALREQERWDETQFTTKIGGKTILSQLFCFVKFHSQLSIWCPIMRKLAVPAP
jgi:nicotinamide riboside transporter PnuC